MGGMTLWQLARRKSSSIAGHEGPVVALAADWGMQLVVTGSWGGCLRGWCSSDNGMQLHPRGRHECAFGRVRALDMDFSSLKATLGSSDGCIHIVNTTSGEIDLSLQGHLGAVTAVRSKFQ